MLGLHGFASFPLVAGSAGCSSLWYTGFSLWWLLLLCSTWASVVVPCGLMSCSSWALEHGLSCSEACRIFQDRESNPRLLYWQAKSLPLSQQDSPLSFYLNEEFSCHTKFLFAFKNNHLNVCVQRERDFRALPFPKLVYRLSSFPCVFGRHLLPSRAHQFSVTPPQREPHAVRHAAANFLFSNLFPQSRGSQPGEIWPPGGHLSMSGDIFGCHN